VTYVAEDKPIAVGFLLRRRAWKKSLPGTGVHWVSEMGLA
jgi:hypothetical protein